MYFDINDDDKSVIEHYCLKFIEEDGYLYLNNFKVEENATQEKKEFGRYLKKELNLKKTENIKIPMKISKIVAEVLKSKNPNCKAKDYCVYDSKKVMIKKISNLDQYIKIIHTIRKPIEDKKVEIFFRGQNDFAWGLLPYLYRNDNWVINEDLMTEEMIRQYPNFLDDKRRIDTLTKLQHYEFPTRLLDITENPLVALFFACSDKDFTTDGRIFYFIPNQNKIKYPNSDTVTILSNISKMDCNFGSKSIKDDNVKNKFLWFIQDEKPNFEDLMNPNLINEYCFVKPHFNNERIKSQSGAFILVGIGEDKMNMPKIQDDSIKNKMLIMIDRTKKKALLEELNHIGINEGTIYPEMNQVASYVRNKYSI